MLFLSITAFRRNGVFDYLPEQHFRGSAEEYILFYNEARQHQTLNFQTPQAFEDIFVVRFIKNT